MWRCSYHKCTQPNQPHRILAIPPVAHRQHFLSLAIAQAAERHKHLTLEGFVVEVNKMVPGGKGFIPEVCILINSRIVTLRGCFLLMDVLLVMRLVCRCAQLRRWAWRARLRRRRRRSFRLYDCRDRFGHRTVHHSRHVHRLGLRSLWYLHLSLCLCVCWCLRLFLVCLILGARMVVRWGIPSCRFECMQAGNHAMATQP